VTSRTWAALFFVGGVWGASFLFVRVALDEVSPLQIVLFRTVAGAAVLSLLLRRGRLEVRLTRGRAAALAGLGLVSTVVPFFLISWAETRIDSGTAGILNAVMPIFTLLLAVAVFDDERMSLRAAGGALLGVAGVVVLSGGPSAVGDSSILGDLAVVGATACHAVGNVTVRVLVRTVPSLFISASNIIVAAVVVAVIAAAFDRPVFDLSWKAWGSLLTLGVFGTGFAYIAYYYLIEHAGSFRASLVTYLIPIVAVILGAVVLGEDIGTSTLEGGLLIVAGVAIGTGTVFRRTEPRPEPPVPDFAVPTES
jgi:drug/metabolite transporter (DMT)-like permease